MTGYEVRDAVEADAHELAPLMAEADRVECYRASGATPLEALLAGHGMSYVSRACVGPSGKVCGMWGVGASEEHAPWSRGWFLGADELRAKPRTFLAVTVADMNWVMDREARGLYAVVDEQYGAALRWLDWLGFTPRARGPIGIGGEPFVLMALEASAWVASATTTTASSAS